MCAVIVKKSRIIGSVVDDGHDVAGQKRVLFSSIGDLFEEALDVEHLVCLEVELQYVEQEEKEEEEIGGAAKVDNLDVVEICVDG